MVPVAGSLHRPGAGVAGTCGSRGAPFFIYLHLGPSIFADGLPMETYVRVPPQATSHWQSGGVCGWGFRLRPWWPPADSSCGTALYASPAPVGGIRLALPSMPKPVAHVARGAATVLGECPWFGTWTRKKSPG